MRNEAQIMQLHSKVLEDWHEMQEYEVVITQFRIVIQYKMTWISSIGSVKIECDVLPFISFFR